MKQKNAIDNTMVLFVCFFQSILMVTQECDYYKAERDGKALITPPPNLEKYHLIKELTESKTKLKKIAEEL